MKSKQDAGIARRLLVKTLDDMITDLQGFHEEYFLGEENYRAEQTEVALVALKNIRSTY